MAVAEQQWVKTLNEALHSNDPNGVCSGKPLLSSLIFCYGLGS